MDKETQDRFFTHLIAVADHLVTGLEITDLADRLMHTCVDMLPATSAGVLIADEAGSLRVLASSSDEARDLELLAIQSQEGPCLDAIRTGEVVSVPELAAAADRWPTFAPAALGEGFTGACALPLTIRGRTIGALNLFLDGNSTLSSRQLQIARLLAHLGSVGIVNNHTSQQQERLAEQLQSALDSRVVIEQAKGVIAARAGVGVGVAFDLLRSAARASQRPVLDVATDVVRGHLLPSTLVASTARREEGPGTRLRGSRPGDA